MKKLIYLVVLSATASCQTTTVSESKNDSIPVAEADTVTQTFVDQTNDADEADEADGIDPGACIFAIDLTTTDALLETGSYARSDSSEEAEVTWELDRAEPVSFNGKSKNIYPESADICDRDHWYNVKLLNRADSSGWVNGVTLIFDSKKEEGRSYTINGTQYKLYNGADTQITANDESLFGCEDLTIPYFHNPVKKTVSFIATNESLIADDLFVKSHNGWLALASSDGGHAVITDISEAESGRWKISLQISYQDGGARAIIYFSEDQGLFTAHEIEKLEESADQQQ